ncbi:Pyrophosphate--fructose [Carex littledalei]|uniref:Pyrophosphate--fructose n=1 Tax=Carex littledalei TaxID=544730 RepID=A0A833VSU5_9POAL|nr:Pyrophosphate--fructose [Carex littledalei]
MTWHLTQLSEHPESIPASLCFSPVNAQLISNVCTDALSAEKYYYFIRLMGRKASHVALECALQSHPNMVILGEEVAASKLTIFDLAQQICDAVQARAEIG